jgi:tetratricopeptide (TPR) repeat protein
MEAAWSHLQSMGRERTLRAATLLNNWALVMNGLGRPLQGEALLRRAAEIMGDDAGGQGLSAMMRANLAQMLWELGRYEEAVGFVESGYAQAVRLGEVRQRKECLMMRAQVYLSMRRPVRAAAALDELEALLKQGEASPYWRSFQSLHLARLALLREDRSAAVRLADRAVETGRAGSLNGARMSFLLLGRGEMGLSLGRVREAEADAKEVLVLQGPPGGPDDASCRRGAAELLLAQARRAQGDPVRARESAARAVRELAPTLGGGHAKTRLAGALAAETRPEW